MSNPNFEVIFYIQPEKGRPGNVYLVKPNEPSTNKGNVIELLFKSAPKETLKRLIVNIYDKTCRNLVNQDYLIGQIGSNQILMILIDTTAADTISNSNFKIYKNSKKKDNEVRGNPVAFLLGQINPTDYYVDIICAQSNGRLLLDCFERYAQSVPGVKSVSLSAIPTVLTYYPKFGYEHRKTCNTPADVVLPQTIKSRDKSMIPTTKDQVLADNDFLDYMIELRKHGYGELDGDCANPTRDTIKNCGDSGYYMKKCF